MKLKFLLLAVLFAALPLSSWAAEGDPISMETQLVDVPTAQVLDRYQASFLTRAYAHGSMMETIEFGVFPRVNLGVSFAAHELIGSSSSIKVLSPDFQAKWKIFDGDLYLPAIAIGYDGRRYGYGYKNRVYTYPVDKNKKYMDDRKGGYIALSREIIIPGLDASAGLNFADFDWEEMYFFTGMSYVFKDMIGLVAEWDNIRNIRDSRLNMAARFYLHPSLSFDAGVRRIGRGDESERIIQFRYVGNF